MSLNHYIKLKTSKEESIAKKLKKLARETTNQYALYYYLWLKGKATLYQLYRIYNEIAGRRLGFQQYENSSRF